MNPPTPFTDTGQQGTDADPRQNIRLDTREMSLASGHMSIAGGNNEPPSPLSASAPLDPRTPLARRTSHTATSPLIGNDSPRLANPPLRRTSSSTSLNRPPSSPHLARKGSRTSLGGSRTPVEQERRPTPKRSISNLISGLREAHSTMESIEEPIPLTAPEIAQAHFARDLASHARPDVDTETVVILHDACYGHRYSRLRTTKTALSLIVERPERIHASILGASTAYVRLGGHHAGAYRAPHPDHTQVSTPPFKIRRSDRSINITSSCVTNVHGTGWMSELRGMCHSVPERLAAGAPELRRTPLPGEPEKQRLHEGDLYLAPESLDAFQGALGGVADAIDAVFAPGSRTKRAFVAVRPPGHHCSADLPGGFCWLNNVHVGIEYGAQTYGLTHAAILDFDLHHGDGSQSIAWERNSQNNVKRLNAKPNSRLKLGPDLGYYSIHDINSYPCESGDHEKVQAASLCIENAHGQSIWNVHLQPWRTEDEFWRLYEDKYLVLLEKARNFLQHHDRRLKIEGKITPRSAIFISAGFDASEWEGSGMQRHKVNVPTEFYARFTQDIVKLAQSIESCEGRVISVLEGGYSDRALCSGVMSHLSGLCATSVTSESQGIGSLLQQMNGLSVVDSEHTIKFDKDWWSAANLTALENKVNPPPPPQAKKGRTGPQPTYATPTESFAYKVVDPHKFARSVSGTMREGPAPTRPPTPPPPEVDWVVATQELSNLLIPTDRQTKSCTAEKLAVARTKKEHTSATPALSSEQSGQPRQLRDRKPKAPAYAESAHSDETGSVRAVSRAESRSSRRETIDVLPADNASTTAPRRVSRRLSAGSAFGTTNHAFDADAPPVPSLPSKLATTAANGAMRPPPAPVPKAQPNMQKSKVPPKVRKPTTQTSSSTTAPSTKPALAAAASAVVAPEQPKAASSQAPPASDVDGLTNGMRKITLKVSATKEEHDRKQKEKMDAERRTRALKGAETRRANAAAKKAVEDTTAARAVVHQDSMTAMHIPLQTGAVEIAQPALPAQPPQPALFAAEDALALDQAHRVSDAELLHREPGPGVENNVAMASAQEGVVHRDSPLLNMVNNPIAAPPHEYAHPVPTPNATAQSLEVPEYAISANHDLASPSSPQQQDMNGRLPVWSSTGPIPFGTLPKQDATPMQQQQQRDDGGKSNSVWDGSQRLAE